MSNPFNGESVIKFACIAALLSLPMLSPAIAQTCSKHSPAHTVALLELYTSEGCSSCPPADKFVSNLRGLTSDQVVPLSLHVDYWDYIGWKDRFASPLFSQRQRWLSQAAGSRTIYTPEFFVSGKELRDWSGDLAASVKRVNARPAQATISMTLGKVAAGSVPLAVQASAAQGGQLMVALYQNKLISAVSNGENKGVSLQHDYVVREWLGPVALTADAKVGLNQAVLAKSLLLPAMADAKNVGVVAFVQSDNGEVLQALALPLCGSGSM